MLSFTEMIYIYLYLNTNGAWKIKLLLIQNFKINISIYIIQKHNADLKKMNFPKKLHFGGVTMHVYRPNVNTNKNI